MSTTLLIEKRYRAYSRWKRFKTPELKEEFCRDKMQVNPQIRKAKSEYYANRFGNTIDGKSKWKTIREIDQFIRYVDSIVEFEADLNNNEYPLTSHHALEVHRYELKSNWSRVKVAYDKFLLEAEKEHDNTDDPLDLESFKTKYKRTYTTYCNCLTKLSEMSDALHDRSTHRPELVLPLDNIPVRPSTSRELETHDAYPSETHGLHLPPIEIETFNGDYASWPTFRDLFTAIVSNSRASNVEKLFFLTQKTKGEAKEIVQQSPLTNQGFDLAWNNLYPKFYSSSKIDMLIGGDIFPLIVRSGTMHNVCQSLLAQETIFGWILTGPVSRQSSPTFTVNSHFCEISLDKEISRFWEVENLSKKNFMSPSDKTCEELYLRTTKRNANGRYVVSLPFKEYFPKSLNIGHSRSSAMAQFFRNEARLVRNPDFKLQYDNVVQEYEELGHMFKVDSSNLSDNPNVYYLPHHAVIKPDSVTTKVRVVFNASAPSSNGQSLNSLLHVGPVLQNDLTILILRWRFFQFVFNADIQKMYRQILVNQEHTPYQRILFRSNPNQPICDYELKTVTFGVNCAPYLAIRTLLQLADDVQSTYPIASSILRNSMYVDDVLAGTHTKEESNSKDIIADIPLDHLLHEDFLKFEDNSSTKTLGIRWNACSDEFYFVADTFPELSNFTKREILSQIAKLFDPAGWLAPCIVLAKMLMQKIWMEGTGWDEVITPDTLQQWKTFQSNYTIINTIRIPRWINYCPKAEIQFHGFCDASEKAYAAALYVRIANDNFVSTHLISSKTKVAPIKTLSIPRLELCGAVLLAEMVENLVPTLVAENYSVFCWTDSTIVLSWLAKPPCNWLTFVANRVSKITQVIEYSKWNHVNSETNPADIASRGVYPENLVNNELWWFGPHWLRSERSQWPRLDLSKITETIQEVKPVKVHFSYFSNFDDLLERFSSYNRAMRVLAYVYRFYYRTHRRYRSSFVKDSTVLSSSEIIFIRDKLISVCQKAWYPNEYKALSANQILPKSSSILNLNPFLDPEGIIRSCGRLESSPGLTYNEKHPIIIPYNAQFSKLLVKFVHDVSLHGGNQLVLRLLRTQYWIPKAKNLIKFTINKCKTCIVYKKRCQQQIMAALPSERAEITRPFTHTGLDFAGPFDVKSYSGRACRISKGYVCVFVCFSTKAIHLEATSELSTQAFLAAFSRFVARRGCPLHLHSDNGKNFVGASKVLAKEFIQTSQQRILANYAHQNISWHFIPAGPPHMGGLWEAGVKSFKTHFRKITGCYKYTFEELSTLLSKIESCLNSRPISPISTDPSDTCALTPGHFLIGTPILAPVDPQVTDIAISITNRWQRLKLIHQNFCSRWKNEYLKEMNKRTKWQRPELNIEKGVMVVIKDENLPSNSWRLGRVVKTYSGSDHRVRVADVLTQRGLITRPIVKLVILPTES
ncbi:uncharacterized protein LOC135951499 [Calliphora vicina]|uniref:uncharacterized protein LOC135951499 n=1 Tax=Calliphora vicina TaxID=7373 RepID=UPI00325A9424